MISHDCCYHSISHFSISQWYCGVTSAALMVNGLHLYSAFFQSALQFASHSPIHAHTYTPMAVHYHARCWPDHREQFGVQCFAQGHVGAQIELPNLQLEENPLGILSHSHITIVSFHQHNKWWHVKIYLSGPQKNLVITVLFILEILAFLHIV